jgi:hypothetical protein
MIIARGFVQKVVFLMRLCDLKKYYVSNSSAARHAQVHRNTLYIGPVIKGQQYLRENLSLRFEKLTNGKLKTHTFIHQKD